MEKLAREHPDMAHVAHAKIERMKARSGRWSQKDLDEAWAKFDAFFGAMDQVTLFSEQLACKQHAVGRVDDQHIQNHDCANDRTFAGRLTADTSGWACRSCRRPRRRISAGRSTALLMRISRPLWRALQPWAVQSSSASIRRCRPGGSAYRRGHRTRPCFPRGPSECVSMGMHTCQAVSLHLITLFVFHCER